MNDFDKFFGASYDLVDVIKFDGKNFIATAYDKHAKRLCMIKERDACSMTLTCRKYFPADLRRAC